MLCRGHVLLDVFGHEPARQGIAADTEEENKALVQANEGARSTRSQEPMQVTDSKIDPKEFAQRGRGLRRAGVSGSTFESVACP